MPTKYDVIVIGAGSAGSILATRLSEDPGRSVLLLEAGPDYPRLEQLPKEIKLASYAGSSEIEDSKHSWRFVARATDKAPPMRVPRGKLTGGSSAINNAAFLRGIPEDYDAWASFGNDHWSFEKVLPYFRRMETDRDFHDDWHGTDGPITVGRFERVDWLPAQVAFYNACIAAGFPDCPDENHPDSSGVGPIPWNVVDGVRYSTALGYLSQSRHRLNLTLRPECMVQRIVFQGNKAVGVVVESKGEMFTAEGDQIILSAGAIGSPQLLMVSGVGPAGILRSLEIPLVKELPGVGQNLRDHPMLSVTWRTKEGFTFDSEAPRSQVDLRYTSPNSHLRNDMIITIQSFATQRLDRDEDHMTPPGVRMTVCLVLALGSGELRLTSADPASQPYINFNYLTDPFDRQRLRDAVHLCLELARHEGFKDILEERTNPTDADLSSDDALDDWMLREVVTLSHVSCTCKMGPATDPMAVVDQYGKVHGLEGLRVVDASIMPDCVRGWINATVMMIGERIADMMAA